MHINLTNSYKVNNKITIYRHTEVVYHSSRHQSQIPSRIKKKKNTNKRMGLYLIIRSLR